MARFNPAKHPRDSRGRFRPTVVPGSTTVRVGRGGDFVGVKAGTQIRVGNSRRVLLKGIVGIESKKAVK
ncbi:hypothetical protein FB388_1479 [Pseudonocardia cypriaca]|uniref:Uncharacterized protein n=1 Tax=Pseudonocardia cypriaca TaxID=882449 RepID=A0A543GDI2_9PSEU|nr:hypothetical protein FB388_1479 [Pseudonocardia cypriaca]